MASGLEMYRALKRATEELPINSEFNINPSDKCDLCKLTESDLRESLGFDRSVARAVDDDLLRGRITELGKAIGLRLLVVRHARNLIPGEGIRRAAELMKDDPATVEQVLAEVNQLRHPEQ